MPMSFVAADGRRSVCSSTDEGAYPKREFRAAWIQSVNGQFRGMPAEKLKQNLTGQLNSLQKAGINAIIFQVRPEADALYASGWNRGAASLPECRAKHPNPIGILCSL